MLEEGAVTNFSFHSLSWENSREEPSEPQECTMQMWRKCPQPGRSHQSQRGMGAQLLHIQQEHSWVWDTAKEPSGKQAPERGRGNQTAEQGTTTSHHEILSPAPSRPMNTFGHGPLGHLPLPNPTPVPVPSSGHTQRSAPGTAQATVLRSGLLLSAKAQVSNHSPRNRRREGFCLFKICCEAWRESASLVFKCCVVWI